MKRYLVIFIDEDDNFCCEPVMAEGIADALNAFARTGLAYAEIYSVSRAA